MKNEYGTKYNTIHSHGVLMAIVAVAGIVIACLLTVGIEELIESCR